MSRFLVQLQLPLGQRPNEHRDHRLIRPPTPRHIALLCLKHPETLTPAQHTMLDQLGDADRAIAGAHILVSQIATMTRDRQGADLEQWIAAATSSAIPNLRRFATGLRLDLAAVQAGLTEEWSNGQTEGHINRLNVVAVVHANTSERNQRFDDSSRSYASVEASHIGRRGAEEGCSRCRCVR